MKVVKIDILPWDILISIGDTEQKVIDYLIKRVGYMLSDDEIIALNWDNSSKQGRTVQLKSKAVIMWVKTQKPSLVAHEAFHAATFILESAGLKFSQDSDEMWGYLIEKIVRETMMIGEKPLSKKEIKYYTKLTPNK